VRYGLGLALLLCFGLGHAQFGLDEDQDFGVAPSAEIRPGDYTAATPREIPGAKVMRTAELRRLLQAAGGEPPLLFDVIGGEGHQTLPGAIWIPEAGRGRSFDDPLQGHLAKFLEFATKGNRGRTLIFYCTGPRCWLSYNASLRAARLGYTAVYWYRGGLQSWGASGGALVDPLVVWQRPPV
jgi:rhodanese-related sulfurtransferase